MDYSKVRVVARRLISPGLKQLTITDIIHHPMEESLFVDVKRADEVRDESRRCTTYWRVNVTSGTFQYLDVLTSSEHWLRQYDRRFYKSEIAAQTHPRWLRRRQLAYPRPGSIYFLAEKQRVKAVAAVEKEMTGTSSVRALLHLPPGPIHTSIWNRMTMMWRRFSRQHES